MQARLGLFEKDLWQIVQHEKSGRDRPVLKFNCDRCNSFVRIFLPEGPTVGGTNPVE